MSFPEVASAKVTRGSVAHVWSTTVQSDADLIDNRRGSMVPPSKTTGSHRFIPVSSASTASEAGIVSQCSESEMSGDEVVSKQVHTGIVECDELVGNIAQPRFQLERCTLDDIWVADEEETSCLPCSAGPILSIGSSCHHAGTCTPCKFLRSHRGCRMGAACNLCHYPHEELTHSGIRRAMRLSAQAKRQQRAREAQDAIATGASAAMHAVHSSEPSCVVDSQAPVSIPLSSLVAIYSTP